MTKRCFRPRIDGLESRELFHIGVMDLGYSGKIVDIQGADGRDSITIADGAVYCNNEALATPAGTVGIYADGNGGDDMIANGQTRIPVILHGGAGNDWLFSVDFQGYWYTPNVLYGDEGFNQIYADSSKCAVYVGPFGGLSSAALGQVVFFYDDSPTANSIVVSSAPWGDIIVANGSQSIYLPNWFRGALFDLGAGDDAFVDDNPSLVTLVYGGDGDDFLIADVAVQ